MLTKAGFEVVDAREDLPAADMKRMIRDFSDKVREAGGEVLSTEGEETGEWVLVDLGPVVVHIMQPTVRAHFDLEGLWGPGKPAGHAAEKAAMKAAAKKAVTKASEASSEDSVKDQAPAKKPSARKPAASKTTAEKPAAKKAAPRKAPSKKPAAAKPRAKKPAAE